MATRGSYRLLFAIGAGVFFLSSGGGLVYGLVTERRLPPVEIEDRLPRTVEDYRQFAELKPRNPIALVFLGEALVRSGERDEAVDVFERALELRSAPVTVHERLARLYLEQGRLEMARRQARATYRKGGQLDAPLMRALNLSPRRR